MNNDISLGIDVSKLLEGLKKAENEITNLHKSIKDGNKVGTETFTDFGKSVIDVFKNTGKEGEKAFNELFDNINNSSKKFNENFINAFSKISVVKDVVAGAFSAVNSLISEPIQFEKSMGQLSFISKDVKENYNEVSDSLKKMGRELPIKSTSELVLAMKDLASDGYNTKDSLKLIEEASRGAVAGNAEVCASVGALKNIIGSYGLEVGKSAEIQDKLFKASQMTGEAYGNIANSMSGAITNVATLGVSFDSFLGSVTALTKMNTPIQESIGLMDMASKQFTASLGSAYMETHSLTDIMVGVYEKAGGEFGKIVDMGIKPELARAILKIGENANTVKNDISELSSSAGTMQQAFEINANNTENLTQTIQNNFNSVKDSFASALLPVVNEILQVFKNVMQWIGDLPAPVKTFISSIGILTTAFVTLKVTGILPIIADFKTFATKSVTDIIGGLGKAKVAFLSTTGITNGLRGAMSALGTAGPMALVTIAGLLLSFLPQITNWVKNLISSSKEAGGMFVDLKETFVNLWNTIKDLFSQLTAAINPIVTTLKDLFIGYIQNIFMPILKVWIEGFKKVVSFLKDVFVVYIDIAITVIGVWIKIIKELVNSFIDFGRWIVDIFPKAIDKIVNFGSSIYESSGAIKFLVDGFKKGVNTIIEIAVRLWENIKQIFNKIVDFVTNVGNKIADFYKSVKEWAFGKKEEPIVLTAKVETNVIETTTKTEEKNVNVNDLNFSKKDTNTKKEKEKDNTFEYYKFLIDAEKLGLENYIEEVNKLKQQILNNDNYKNLLAMDYHTLNQQQRAQYIEYSKLLSMYDKSIEDETKKANDKIQKLFEEQKKINEAKLKSLTDEADKILTGFGKSGVSFNNAYSFLNKAIDEARLQENNEILEKYINEKRKIEEQDITKTAFWVNQIGNAMQSLSQNFGQLLVSGFSSEGFKDVAKTIKEGFKTILVAIIDSISNMLYAGTITSLIEAIFNPAKAVADAGILLAGKISLEVLKGAVMAMATGGVVNKPTLVMAGEAGAEMYAPVRDFRQEIRNIIVQERKNLPAINNYNNKKVVFEVKGDTFKIKGRDLYSGVRIQQRLEDARTL